MRALGCIDDALEAETRLHQVAERIRGAMGASTARADGTDDPRASTTPSRRSAPISTTTSSSRSRSPPPPRRSASARPTSPEASRRPSGSRRTPTSSPPARGRARPDPRRPAVSRRRDRGRLLRPGPPDPPVQAVPRGHARPIPGWRRRRMTTDGSREVLAVSAHALAHDDDLESTLSTMLGAVARAFGVGSAAIVARRGDGSEGRRGPRGRTRGSNEFRGSLDPRGRRRPGRRRDGARRLVDQLTPP